MTFRPVNLFLGFAEPVLPRRRSNDCSEEKLTAVCFNELEIGRLKNAFLLENHVFKREAGDSGKKREAIELFGLLKAKYGGNDA